MQINAYAHSIHSLPGNYDDLGFITINKAITLARSYPYEGLYTLLQELPEDNHLPAIIFNSDKDDVLSIYANKNNSIFVRYSNNQVQKEYDIGEVMKNDTALNSLESIIYSFYNGSIENFAQNQYIEGNTESNQQTSKSNNSSKINENTFTYRPEFANKATKFTAIVILANAILFLIQKLNHTEPIWVLYIVSGILWIPGIILHISYWMKSYNTIVQANTINKTITIKINDRVTTFDWKEIKICEIVKPMSNNQAWQHYSYVWITLHNKRHYIITSFITEPETFVGLIDTKIIRTSRFMPFLPIL